MSFNIEVQGGKNYLLPTAGKYCPQDIALTAIGNNEGGYCWAKYSGRIDDNEVLVLYGEDFTDSSQNGYAVTTNGVTLNSDIVKVGNSALDFNGSSTLSVDCGNEIDFGAGDFTIDFWIYPRSVTSRMFLIRGNSDGAMAIATYTATQISVMHYNVNWRSTISFALTANKWQHVAVVRANGTIYFYLDGVLKGSKADTNSYAFTDGIILGQGESIYCNMVIDALRVSKAARWTAAFTPPETYDAPAKLLSYVISDKNDAYPENDFAADGFFYKKMQNAETWYEGGNYVWEKSDTDGNLIQYIVSDQSDAFPVDGLGDDGFYYKKSNIVNEMKYATGTSGTTINVSGLDFKPQAIYVYGYMYSSGSYYAWVSLMFNGDELLSNVSGMSAGGLTVNNISVTDDGFTLTITDTRWSCTWHALGY